jgi:carbon-monoxide dehydrogenase small subunit
MSAMQLLSENPDPDDAEIRQALAGNTCRCTGYINIIAAVKDAAIAMRSERS